MVDRSNIVIAAVLGSVVLLAGTTYVLRRPERPPSASSANDDPVAARGVEAREYDPLIRRSAHADDPAAEDSLSARLPAARPTAGPDDTPAREGAPPPEPPPPPPALDATQQAAVDAYAALQAKVGEQVRSKLNARRQKLRNACWEPSVGEASFTYNLSFSPEGTLLAMGIGEPRQAGAAAVGECLRGQALNLDIAAPGQSVSVEVDLNFP